MSKWEQLGKKQNRNMYKKNKITIRKSKIWRIPILKHLKSKTPSSVYPTRRGVGEWEHVGPTTAYNSDFHTNLA